VRSFRVQRVSLPGLIFSRSESSTISRLLERQQTGSRQHSGKHTCWFPGRISSHCVIFLSTSTLVSILTKSGTLQKMICRTLNRRSKKFWTIQRNGRKSDSDFFKKFSPTPGTIHCQVHTTDNPKTPRFPLSLYSKP